MRDPGVIRLYERRYAVGGPIVDIALRAEGLLYLAAPGQPMDQLLPHRPRRFRMQGFSDHTFEFIVQEGKVLSLKQRDPSGELTLLRVGG